MKDTKPNNIVIYEDGEGNVELRADVEKETIWARQEQITQLFGVHQTVVSRHIRNIFKDGEIEAKSNMQKMHNANSDRPILIYSLDIILAVGYRTNSQKAILFRKWATGVLRNYLVNGYSLNKYNLSKSTESLEGLHEAIQLLESNKLEGKLKGKIKLTLTKNLIPK